MLLTLGGGVQVYNEVCFADFILGGSGGMHPQQILEF